MDRTRIETALREFDRRRLQHQINMEQRAVDFFTGIEKKYTEENNDHMRVWAKKQRKKRQADLDWAKRNLEKYDEKSLPTNER